MNNIKGFGKRQRPHKGDYYNECGVLICGSCGKPREWHGTWPQINEAWACCVCNCDLHKNQQTIKETEKREKILLAKIHREWAFPLDGNLVKCTLEKDDKANSKVTNAITKYVNSFDEKTKTGTNLFLYGDVGTGKTFMAAAVLNKAIDNGYKCLFTSFYREISELTRIANKAEYLQNLKSYDFVVFDDFGTERETPYNIEQIYQIINARYLAGKPTIITTNMDNSEFSTNETEKQRIFSRIFEHCDFVLLGGKDRRTSKYKPF